MNTRLRALLSFLFCSMILCSPALQAHDRLKSIPAKRVERQQTIDIKHIAIDLHFDWKEKRAIGKTTITLAPLATARLIALDAGMLAIHTVRLSDGSPLPFTYHGCDRDGGLVITLGRAYKAGGELTLIIGYQTLWVNNTDPGNVGGGNGKGLRFFESTFSEPTRRRQIKFYHRIGAVSKEKMRF